MHAIRRDFLTDLSNHLLTYVVSFGQGSLTLVTAKLVPIRVEKKRSKDLELLRDLDCLETQSESCNDSITLKSLSDGR